MEDRESALETARMASVKQREALQELEAEWARVEALLEEAERSAPTRYALAEAQAWSALQASSNDPVLSRLHTMEATRWGGHRFTASVIDEEGKGSEREVVQWGPLGWVNEGGVWYPLYTRLNQPVPTIDTSWAGAPSALPIDPTVGMAAGKQTDLERTWVSRLQEGGAVMIPLLAVGVLALILVLWKAMSLARIRPVSTTTIDAFVAALSQGKGAQSLDGTSGPARSIFEHVLDHPKASLEQLEELLHERILALLPTLDRHLGTLAVLAGIAPLLGLLGTVTGMIKTFQLITVFGSGDARMLSGGVAEALTTTAVGLIIAVPVLVAHAFLSRRVRVLVADLENTVGRLISRLAVEDAPGG